MCQIFFSIDKIPNWINYEFSNKLNIKTAQELLDKGLAVNDVAVQMGVNKHRIYDAVYNKKLFYPKNYKHLNLIKSKEYINNNS